MQTQRFTRLSGMALAVMLTPLDGRRGSGLELRGARGPAAETRRHTGTSVLICPA